MLDKTKIYCFGSPEFAKVVKELIDHQIIDISIFNNEILQYIGKQSYVFAYSINRNNPGNWLGYSSEPSFYKELGYQKVTPQQFRNTWMPESSEEKFSLTPQKPLKIVL